MGFGQDTIVGWVFGLSLFCGAIILMNVMLLLVSHSANSLLLITIVDVVCLSFLVVGILSAFLAGHGFMLFLGGFSENLESLELSEEETLLWNIMRVLVVIAVFLTILNVVKV